MSTRSTVNADAPDGLAAIDEQIHDLLMRRATRVGSECDGTLAGQAKALRRLVERNKGALPLAALVNVWREIVSAMPGRERLVHVFAGDEVATYRDLARAYFGSGAAMEGHPSASAVIHACAADHAAFGLLPPPSSDEKERPWWAQLAPEGQSGPRVVARLPLLDGGTALSYVIATLEHEPTGDDTSMIILETAADLSRAKLQSLARQAGLDAQLVAVGRDSAASAARLLLLEIRGFVPHEDTRLGSLRELAGDAIAGLVNVGGFAKPLRPSRLARP